MMTTVTTDLASFLLERIAEDERSAQRGEQVRVPTFGNPHKVIPGPITDPRDRRMLVECDAKRRIVALHAESDLFPGACAECGHFDEVGQWGGEAHESVAWPCPTLRLLALPYADHPDYAEEWRP